MQVQPVHVMLFVYGVLFVVASIIVARRRRRAQALMAEPIDDRSCVACGEMRVERLGPGHYRCPSCGYEGGSGLAKRQAEGRREALRKLDPESRRRKGVEALREAHRLLVALDGDLAGAVREQIEQTVLRRHDPYAPNPVENARLRISGMIQEVHGHLDTAAVCLGTEPHRPDGQPVRLDRDVFETGVLSLVASIASSADFGRLSAEVRQLTEQVEDWMRAEGIPFVPARR